jgi:uncharacterized membrane protein YhaH (DUF805 family)
MGFGDSIKSAYSSYAKFSGKADLREYWLFFLYQSLIIIGNIAVFVMTLFPPRESSFFESQN